MNVESICDVLRKFPHLETLSLNNIEDSVTVIRQLCRCNINIKYLAIKYCKPKHTNKIPDSVIRNILYACSYLETLNLEGTQFYSIRFYQELANLRHLKKLNLNKNKYLRIENLINIALNCRFLEDISLNDIYNEKLQISDQDLIFFCNNLSNTLKRIEFDMSNFTCSSYKVILKCTKLEKLSLYNARFISSDVFRKYFVKLKNLKELRLTQAFNLTSNDFIYLSESNILSNLTILDLCGCSKVCNNGLKAIITSCKLNLIYLCLKSCKLIDNIEFIIINCSKLRYLNISYISCYNEQYLLKIPTHVPKLSVLIVDKNNVQNDFLTVLYNKIPKLIIKYSLMEFSDDHFSLIQMGII